MKVKSSTNVLKFMILIVIIILLASNVFAIGITPSKRIVNFKPGQKLIYDIDIINNGHEDLDVVLYPKGEFSDSIKLSEQMIKLASDEQTKRVNVEFVMPDRIDVAGPHTVDIVAVGSTPAPESQESIVKADLAVISKLVIDVPYPQKYAEARIYVLDTEVGKPVVISVPVFNKGEEKIGAAYVKIEVFSSDGTKADELITEARSIRPGKNTKFTAQTANGLPIGGYKAVATIYYDEKQLETETRFNVGELSIEIKNLVVNEFTLGGVAKFDILLYNAWSTTLNNVYAEMQIRGQDNTLYTSFKTVSVDIPAHDVAVLEGYWYTHDVMPGIYTAQITLYYANKVSHKEFELEVYPNKMVARQVGTGAAITMQEELDMKRSAFLVLIILSMSLAIAVLTYKLRKERKASKARQETERSEKHAAEAVAEAIPATESAPPTESASEEQAVKGMNLNK